VNVSVGLFGVYINMCGTKDFGFFFESRKTGADLMDALFIVP